MRADLITTALKSARELADTIFGENRPSRVWAKEVRDQIDAALSAAAEPEPVAWQNMVSPYSILTPEQYGMRLPLAEGHFRPLYASPPPVEPKAEGVALRTEISEETREALKAVDDHIRAGAQIGNMLVGSAPSASNLADLETFMSRPIDHIKYMSGQEVFGIMNDRVAAFLRGGEDGR